jgi:hypothetical protein
MPEHNTSVIESQLWKDDRKYNRRMTNNSVLDSKVLQTLEFVEVMLPLFFWFGLSTSLSTLRVLGHIMTTN